MKGTIEICPITYYKIFLKQLLHLFFVDIVVDEGKKGNQVSEGKKGGVDEG